MEKRTLVKICGLRRVEDAEAANRAMPGFAGFILSQGFRRSIRLEQALELRRILNPRIRTVGVFVDADPAEIGAAAAGGAIDMIQLHGKEENDYIKAIRSLTSLPVIKAFPVSSKKDLEAASASAAQWILLDSGSGTGSTFDWNLLAAFLEERQQDAGDGLFPGNHPWLLAGGLSVGNVQAAIFRFRPTAVDVSSRVETDGWKDPEKMKAFVEAAHEAVFGDGPFVSDPLLSSRSGSPASAVRTTGSKKLILEQNE